MGYDSQLINIECMWQWNLFLSGRSILPNYTRPYKYTGKAIKHFKTQHSTWATELLYLYCGFT